MGSKKGKKQRKHGRCKRNGQAAAYRAERRHEKSHVRRISAHLEDHPNDHYARQMFSTYSARI
jgi:hypothetical protein